MTKRYYEAAVVAEHVARRYPSDEWAAKAADLAMQSLVEAYNTFTARQPRRPTSTASSRPGQVHRRDLARDRAGRLRPADARAWSPSAGASTPRRSPPSRRSAPSSSKWIDAQTSCGDAHWKQSLVLRDKGNAKEADAEVQQAVAKLNTALKARRDANAPDTDPA